MCCARGCTDFCVRHGGGKRCKLKGCGKSAQGRTDFCMAHSGGKDCSFITRVFNGKCGEAGKSTVSDSLKFVEAAMLHPDDKFFYINMPLPKPLDLPDEGEIVLLDSSEQKPSVDFDATNTRAYQSDVLVLNLEEENMREVSRRQCMPESVPSLVDSPTRISSADFDAPDNGAQLVRAHQSGPIMFDSVENDAREGLNGDCLTKSALSLDDSTKPGSLSDCNAAENKAVKVYTRRGRDCWDSAELKQRMMLEELGMDMENEGIIPDILRFVSDKEEYYKKAGKDWKRGYLLSPGTDRSSLIAAMANFLEFDICHLDLTDLNSIVELTNVLVSIRSRSLISIEDFDHWAGKLPDFRTELTLSSLLKIIHGLLSSCGDEQIIVLTTNHNHIERVDAALLCPLNNDLYFHMSTTQPKDLPDGEEIVLLDSLEQKPSVDFDATNNRAYKSDVLVSNSTREASRRQCMPECVLCLVDSTARISSADFDASDNSAHLVRAYQSGPVVFNSEKKNTGKGLNTECLTKSVLILDDLSKQKSLSNIAVTENKSHLVRAYQSGPVVFLSDNKNMGKALKRECIPKSILRSEDLRQHSGGRRDDAAKSFRAVYDPGSHTKDSLALISPEVRETLLIREQPNDCVPLLPLGRLTHEDCVQREKSPDLSGVLQINGVEQRVNKLPRYSGGLIAQSAIGLPDRRHILPLSEKKIVTETLKRKCRSTSTLGLVDRQHVDRRWGDAAKSHGTKRICRQLSTAKHIPKQHGIHRWPFQRSAISLPDGGHILPLSEKKIVRKTLKRKCRRMRVLSLVDRQQHVHRRWEDAAKNIGAKRICRQLVIHRVSIVKRRQHEIHHRWPFQQSAVGPPNGGHVLPLSEKKFVRKTLKRKCRSISVLSLVDRQQHVDRRSEDAVKNIGVKPNCGQLVIHRVSRAKRICRQHEIYHWWPFEQDWATMKGYSLGDERPVEVICISTHLITPASDSENVTKDILLRLSGFMNRQEAADFFGVSVSTFKRLCRKNGIKRWPPVRKEKVWRPPDRQGKGKKKAGRPPDQHGEGNTSTAFETPSHNVQSGMEGEPVYQNQEAYVFRQDFTEGPTALNTEYLIIGSSSKRAIQGKDQSTLSTSYPNHNALPFPQPEITSMLSEKRGVSIDRRTSLASQAETFSDRQICGSSNLTFPICSDQAARSQHVEGQSMQSTVYPDHYALMFPQTQLVSPQEPFQEALNWNEHTNSLASQAEPFSDRYISGSIDQLEGQTTQFIAHPNQNALVFPQFQIPSAQVVSENEERRNLLASQVDALLMGPVSESSQPVTTILQTMPTTTHMIPQTGDFSEIFQLEGQTRQSTSYPNPNDVVPPEPQIPSTQMLSENMGNLEILEEYLSLEEEPSLGGLVSGSVNLTMTAHCDPSPSQQPRPTNRDMMPTAHVMSHLLPRGDLRSVKLKVSYGDKTIKFQVPLTSRINELKEEVKKRLKLEPSSFDLEYKDEDDGDWIFLGCDEDLTNHLQLFSNQVIRLFVVDSDASTKNICECCGSLKRKRQ